MQPSEVDRREFLQSASVGAALAAAPLAVAADSSKGVLAALGGKPIRTEKFTSWPLIEQNDLESWQRVLKEGKWCRVPDGKYDNAFEKTYAELTGTQHCVATANGTSALFCALNALGIGPGDEVLVPPYTFVATINAVLLQHALPVFIDTDRETFQMDARKIEAAITPRTACILPVHLGGNAADMDTILAVAKKHNLPVIEDACQAVLSEWRKKKLGSLAEQSSPTTPPWPRSVMPFTTTDGAGAAAALLTYTTAPICG
jgi:seryl-tRNA(Sec) selenium transferase